MSLTVGALLLSAAPAAAVSADPDQLGIYVGNPGLKLYLAPSEELYVSEASLEIEQIRLRVCGEETWQVWDVWDRLELSSQEFVYSMPEAQGK